MLFSKQVNMNYKPYSSTTEISDVIRLCKSTMKWQINMTNESSLNQNEIYYTGTCPILKNAWDKKFQKKHQYLEAFSLQQPDINIRMLTILNN